MNIEGFAGGGIAVQQGNETVIRHFVKGIRSSGDDHIASSRANPCPGQPNGITAGRARVDDRHMRSGEIEMPCEPLGRVDEQETLGRRQTAAIDPAQFSLEGAVAHAAADIGADHDADPFFPERRRGQTRIRQRFIRCRQGQAHSPDHGQILGIGSRQKPIGHFKDRVLCFRKGARRSGCRGLGKKSLHAVRQIFTGGADTTHAADGNRLLAVHAPCLFSINAQMVLTL